MPIDGSDGQLTLVLVRSRLTHRLAWLSAGCHCCGELGQERVRKELRKREATERERERERESAKLCI